MINDNRNKIMSKLLSVGVSFQMIYSSFSIEKVLYFTANTPLSKFLSSFSTLTVSLLLIFC